MLVTPGKANRRSQLVFDHSYLVDATEAEVGITILPAHSENHFPPESDLPLILQGHKGLRLAAMALGEIVNFNEASSAEAAAGVGSYTQTTGFEQADFFKPIKVGDEVTIKANLTGQSQPNEHGQPTHFTGNASLFVGADLKTQFKGLTIEKTAPPVIEPVLPDQVLESAAQSYVVELLAGDPDQMPLLVSIGRTRFTGFDLTPGKTLVSIAQGVRAVGQRYFVSSIVTDGDGNKVAEINEIQAAVRPSRLIKFALGR